MPAYQRYVLNNVIIIFGYILFWLASVLVWHFPVWVNIGAALVTLALMTVLYSMQHRS